MQESKQFRWGPRDGDVKLYKSFTSNGVTYSLYDSVRLWRMGQTKPDIGKVVRMWETETHEKKVEILWFFRPSEIANWLGDIRPLQNEIFLGCGHGKGLSNLNPLEAIAGKCNVVCSSKDERNPQPTEEELEKAEYIYYRTFDVGKYIISERFPSSIGGFDVVNFFNRGRCTKPRVGSEPKPQPKIKNQKMLVPATKNDQYARVEKGGYSASTSRQINSTVKNERAELKRSNPNQSANLSGTSLPKKRKLLISSDGSSEDDLLPCATTGVSGQEKRAIIKDSCRQNQGPFIRESLDNKASKFTEKERAIIKDSCRQNQGPFIRESLDNKASKFTGVSGQEKRAIIKDSCRQNQGPFIRESLDNKASKFTEKEPGGKQQVSQGISYKYIEVSRRPGMDSSKWLKLEVWSEERLSEANERGTLVVLENMDPSFTSTEVEDIIWTVFQEKVKARMVQPTAFSSPHSGQALVIFRTKEAADKAISDLTCRCLVLGDGRPIVGQRRILQKCGPSGKFPGHLSIDRTRHQKRNVETRNAVATSHHAQGNTIEFDMAVEWRLLQEQSVMWWNALHEGQSKEIEGLMKHMKIRPDE